MRTFRRSTAVAGALFLAVTTLAGCTFGGNARFKETRTVTVQQDAIGPVSVTTKNGAVSIRRSESEPVYIEAIIRAQTQERLDQVVIVATTLDDGGLDVSVDWPGGKRRNSEGVSFEIRVPGADGVNVQTGNGRIDIKDLSGPADLRTSNGRIYVTNHVGPVLADTSNGRIEITNATDLVDARTSNGAVSVSLTPDNPGPVKIDTSNGGVSLNVGAAFTGRLVLSTSNGRVRLDNAPPARIRSVGRNYADLTFGDDDQKSRVDTSNGSISVEFSG